MCADLAVRCRGALTGCARQVRGNLQLPGWTESPGGGKGLAGQVLNGLIIVLDAVWVLGAAAQGSFLVFHQKASHIHSDVEECANASSFSASPLQNEHKLRILFCRRCKSRLAIR